MPSVAVHHASNCINIRSDRLPQRLCAVRAALLPDNEAEKAGDLPGSPPTVRPVPLTGPELVDQLRARLTCGPPDHERFSGAPLDLDGLDAVSLGRVWALVRQAYLGRDVAAPARSAYKRS